MMPHYIRRFLVPMEVILQNLIESGHRIAYRHSEWVEGL